MGRELAQKYPAAQDVFEQGDELLGFALSKLAWEGPEAELNDTLNTQPALMVHSVAAMRVFQNLFPDFQAAFVAGHSMGELSALVAAGALPFSDALLLVQRRGELMKEAGEVAPGGMAAILGLDIPSLENICREASAENEIVQVANDNCPGQVVISGVRPALERAVALAQENGARKTIILAVSIAAHSPLMLHAQEGFNQAVNSAPLIEPHTPIIGNVTAAPLTAVEGIRADLQAQLTSRVRWTESIQHMLEQGVTTFLEIGTGNILSAMLKRIERKSQRFPAGAPADFEKLINEH